MIPANELRLGNYILCDGNIERLAMINNITSAVDVEVSLISKKGERSFSSIQPVPLTDAILQQCQFVYHEHFKFWQLINGKGADRSEMDIDGDYNFIDFMRRPVVKKLTSLHQLQNIYFMLKGKELVFHETVAA